MQLLSIGELAEVLKTSRPTIYRMIDKGMPTYRIGESFKFSIEEVLTWMRKQADKDREEQRRVKE